MNKSTKNSEAFIFLFKKSWQFAGALRAKYVFSLICSVAGTIPAALPPLILALVINEMQGGGITEDNAPHLIFLISLIFLSRLAAGILFFLASYYESVVSFGVMNTYKEYLLKGFTQLGLSWHSKHDSGDSLDKINTSSNGLQRFTSELSEAIAGVMTVLVAIGVVLYFDLVAGGIVIIFFFLLGYLWYRFDIYLVPLSKKMVEMRNIISGKMFDIVYNVISITILRTQKAIYKEMSKYIREIEPPWKKYAFLIRARNNIFRTGFNLILVGVFVYFIYSAGYLGAEYEAGYIVALYLYLVSASISLENFIANYGIYITTKVDVENAETIEREFTLNSEVIKTIEDFKEIKIDNLEFFYSDDEKKISGLKDASLTIKKGEHVAIVGPSGTGKTTLLKVINGLYEGAHCDLTVDGKETKDIDLSEYDLGTTLIPQEPEIFSASIRENITFSSDYDDDSVQNAIKLAEFGEVVSRLPKGLESKINEKGVNLSGGEKQRLALARGMLVSKHKNILLLDEATSSVDSPNEVKIYKNILNKFKDKTVIATIHKLNLLKFFDKIVIFKDGVVKDVGTFEELLANNMEFKKDWDHYISKKKHLQENKSNNRI